MESGGGGALGWWLAVYDADDNPITFVGAANPSAAGAWAYQTATYTVPAGAATVMLYAQVYLPTADTVLRVDDGFLSAGTFYYHADQLGSARMMTDAGGNMVWSGEFLPFGQEWNAQATVNHYKFTGYERDAESNLDYAMARHYTSQYGRFLQPDPAGMAAVDPSNPQTWNQYAYVGGNPLNFTDPTGMQQCQNGHAGCPPAQSPKYFIDSPFGPITCTLDGVPVPCGTAQQIAGSGAAAQIPGTGLPIAGNNGKLYQPVLTGDGAGYINPNNGEVFYGGSEFGLPNLNSTMDGLPKDPRLPTGPLGPGGDRGVGAQQTPTTPQKPPFWQRAKKYFSQYVPCAVAGWITYSIGDPKHTKDFLVTNVVIPAASIRFGPWGVVASASSAGSYDIGSALEINRTCTAQVYGGHS